MTNQQYLPKITWGASYANTLNIAYPMDGWQAYSEPREGSEWVQGMSGVRDPWIIGTDYMLSAQFRWIPAANTTSPIATGWNGVAGWRAFLEYARDSNPFRFYPNKDAGTYYESYLVEPLKGGHELEPDGTRAIRLIITNSSGSYDGY